MDTATAATLLSEDTHTLSSTTNFVPPPPYTASNNSWCSSSISTKPTFQRQPTYNCSNPVSSTSPGEVPTLANSLLAPNPYEFRSLDVYNSGRHLTIHSPTPCHLSVSKNTSTRFYVRNSRWTNKVTLSFNTKKGSFLGVLKLSSFRWSDATFAVGNPRQGFVQWKSLKRVSFWTHGTYEFEVCRGGISRVFTWQRTRRPFFGDQPDLELREKVERGSPPGEVLALYKGCQRLFRSKRGTFKIRKGVMEGSWVNGRTFEDWSNWELMVLLTGCGLIEGSRRRKRSRRRTPIIRIPIPGIL